MSRELRDFKSWILLDLIVKVSNIKRLIPSDTKDIDLNKFSSFASETIFWTREIPKLNALSSVVIIYIFKVKIPLYNISDIQGTAFIFIIIINHGKVQVDIFENIFF